MNLEGKVALVTGARRVGGQLARRLARSGASVLLTFQQSREAIERTVGEIRADGGRASSCQADLSDADQAARAVDQAASEFGRLDVLVNMASTYRRTPFDTLKPSDFDAMIAANLAGPYHTSVAAAKAMRRQPLENGLCGKIVTVGDWATERPYRDYLPYLVAKGALTTMTLALAKELAPEITVNLVQPAMIEPPPDLTEADLAEVIACTPMARSGVPDDLNSLILYLLEGTDFATGSCFRVDGGRFLGTE